MANPSLHKGHRERLRQKFLKCEEALLQHELFEMLLFYAIPRKNTNEIAHELVNRFKNPLNMFGQPVEELMKVKGIGESAALFLKLIGDICIEYDTSYIEKPIINDQKELEEYVHEQFKGKKRGDCLLINMNDFHEVENQLEFNMNEFKGDPKNSEYDKILEYTVINDCIHLVLAINHKGTDVMLNMRDIKFIKSFDEHFKILEADITACLICNEKSSFYIKKSEIESFF